jgi:hypothetical protein
MKQITYFDAHVHLHSCFNVETFISSTFNNFKKNSVNNSDDSSYVILLTDGKGENGFERLESFLINQQVNFQKLSTKESFSFIIKTGDYKKLIVIKGKQIITKENLELLALATPQSFADGKSTEDLIEKVLENDAVPVLPWGFGKWAGERGRIVEKMIDKFRDKIFLGDNGNRLKLFNQNKNLVNARINHIKIISGSDPLPFKSENKKAGSFGFNMEFKIDPQEPAKSFKQALRDPGMVPVPFGSLENILRFARNQFGMQLRKI